MDEAKKQSGLSEELALAWRDGRWERAEELIALGVDPMSVKEPVLAISLFYLQWEEPLALAPHRWRETEPGAMLEWGDATGKTRALQNPLYSCVKLAGRDPTAAAELRALFARLEAGAIAKAAGPGRSAPMAKRM